MNASLYLAECLFFISVYLSKNAGLNNDIGKKLEDEKKKAFVKMNI